MAKRKRDDGNAGFEECQKLLTFLLKHKESGTFLYIYIFQSRRRRPSSIFRYFIYFSNTAPFREPVDWKAWKLFDYPKLIKHPMDMATVQVR